MGKNQYGWCGGAPALSSGPKQTMETRARVSGRAFGDPTHVSKLNPGLNRILGYHLNLKVGIRRTRAGSLTRTFSKKWRNSLQNDRKQSECAGQQLKRALIAARHNNYCTAPRIIFSCTQPVFVAFRADPERALCWQLARDAFSTRWA